MIYPFKTGVYSVHPDVARKLNIHSSSPPPPSFGDHHFALIQVHNTDFLTLWFTKICV
jgi:hypothetical protein